MFKLFLSPQKTNQILFLQLSDAEKERGRNVTRREQVEREEQSETKSSKEKIGIKPII